MMNTMNRFLIISFEFCKLSYSSLILCKAKTDGAEYRITVMNGELEKQVCSNNIIREINGCLQVELSSNNIQRQIKTAIAKALGRLIGKPVNEVEATEISTVERLNTNDLPVE